MILQKTTMMLLIKEMKYGHIHQYIHVCLLEDTIFVPNFYLNFTSVLIGITAIDLP